MTNPLLFLIIYMTKGNNLMAKNMVQLTNSKPYHGALAKTSHLNQKSNQKSKFSLGMPTIVYLSTIWLKFADLVQ